MEETKQQQSTLFGLKMWLAIVSAFAVLGILAYALFTVRQYIPVLGIIYLYAIGAIPFIAVIVGCVYFFKFLTRPDVIEIGPSGSLLRVFHKVTEYHPLGVKEYKGTTRQSEKPKEESTNIPTLVSLVEQKELGGADLLLGYHVDGTPRWGTWQDVRTFAVGGKSRSGKTVTMVFYIVQALLSGAEVWIADPHYGKKTGLLNVLRPLWPYLRIARVDKEIVSLVKEFRETMKARTQPPLDDPYMDIEEATTSEYQPILLVVDEWTGLLRDLDEASRDMLVDTVLGGAEEYAGVDGYAMIAGQEWTARESGGKRGAAIRRSIHAAYVHRMDEDFAKFLLPGGRGKKLAKDAPNLKTGHAFFAETEGEFDYLLIPYYGEKREAVLEAAKQLRMIAPGPTYEQIGPSTVSEQTPPVNDVNTVVSSKQAPETPVNGLYRPVETVSTIVSQEVNEIEHKAANIDVNATFVNGVDLKGVILRMHKQEIPLRKIAKVVGLDGSRYEKFKHICKELGISSDSGK